MNKKSISLAISLVFGLQLLSFATPATKAKNDARNAGSNPVKRMTGQAFDVDQENSTGVKKSGIYGKSSLDSLEDNEKIKTKTVNEELAPVKPFKSNLNMKVIDQNLLKDELVATGIMYFKNQEFDKAIKMFQQSLDIDYDRVSNRYLQASKINKKLQNLL